jgi:hypothetical protein
MLVSRFIQSMSENFSAKRQAPSAKRQAPRIPFLFGFVFPNALVWKPTLWPRSPSCAHRSYWSDVFPSRLDRIAR